MPSGLAGERRRPQNVEALTMLLPCQGRPPQLCDGDHLDPQKLGAISGRVAPRHWMVMGEQGELGELGELGEQGERRG